MGADFIVGDSLPLAAAATQGRTWESVVTRMPEHLDPERIEYDAGWIMGAVAPDGYAIFYQRDRREGLGLVSLPHHLINAAERVGLSLMWHKVIGGEGTGMVRPTYGHLLAFSETGRPGEPTPDVIAAPPSHRQAGEPFNLDVAKLAVGFLHAQGVKRLVDPFCRGAVVAATADAFGLHSLSIGLDADRVEYAAKALAPAESDADASLLGLLAEGENR